MTEQLTPELKAAFEAILQQAFGSRIGVPPTISVDDIYSIMLKAYNLDKWVDAEVKRCPTMTGLLVWTGKEVGYRIFSKTHEEFSTDAFITRTGVTHWQPLPAAPIRKGDGG